MKNIILFCFAMMLIIISAGCSRAPYSEDFISIVEEHQDLLAETIENEKLGREPNKALLEIGVKKIYYKTYGDYCEFLCFQTFSHYSGFYFSGDDTPRGWEDGVMQIVESEEGWRWESDVGDTYYTERICENWFMYFTYM